MGRLMRSVEPGPPKIDLEVVAVLVLVRSACPSGAHPGATELARRLRLPAGLVSRALRALRVLVAPEGSFVAGGRRK